MPSVNRSKFRRMFSRSKVYKSIDVDESANENRSAVMDQAAIDKEKQDVIQDKEDLREREAENAVKDKVRQIIEKLPREDALRKRFDEENEDKVKFTQ